MSHDEQAVTFKDFTESTIQAQIQIFSHDTARYESKLPVLSYRDIYLIRALKDLKIEEFYF